ncbi:helix-turn-helix transcriptional regulator, partial [Candidatus Thiosymbion oneisti]
MVNEAPHDYAVSPPGDVIENEYRPDYAVPPGEVLEYELELRRMPGSELARRTGLTEQRVDAILRSEGEPVITSETAIRLERALGMPADYWLNLEARYQEAQARLTASEPLPPRAKIAQHSKSGFFS